MLVNQFMASSAALAVAFSVVFSPIGQAQPLGSDPESPPLQSSMHSKTKAQESPEAPSVKKSKVEEEPDGPSTLMMDTDERQLQNKVWIGGPATGTLENYHFNVAIWDVMHKVLTFPCLEQKMQPAKRTPSQQFSFLKGQDLAKAISSFSEGFKSYEATHPISEFFWGVYGYFMDLNPSFPLSEYLMRKSAIKGCNLAERELVNLHFFIKNNYNPTDPASAFHYDPRPNPEQQNILVRYYKVLIARRSLMSPHNPPQKKAKTWNYILKYDISTLTADDYFAAAKAHMDIHVYSRAIELIEEILEWTPKQPTYTALRNYRLVAQAHFGLKNYAQAADFLDQVLQLSHVRQLGDLQIAVSAHFLAGNTTRAEELKKEAEKPQRGE